MYLPSRTHHSHRTTETDAFSGYERATLENPSLTTMFRLQRNNCVITQTYYILTMYVSRLWVCGRCVHEGVCVRVSLPGQGG